MTARVRPVIAPASNFTEFSQRAQPHGDGGVA